MGKSKGLGLKFRAAGEEILAAKPFTPPSKHVKLRKDNSFKIKSEFLNQFLVQQA